MYNNNKNKTEENPNTASRNAFEDPPRGTSTDKTSELFEERKFYRDGAFKDFIFKEENLIDFWNVKNFYGRVNKQGMPIICNENSLKAITSVDGDSNPLALNFVADAFDEMSAEFDRLRQQGKNIVNENSVFYPLQAVTAWKSAREPYASFISTYFDAFANFYIDRNIEEKRSIVDFSTFLDSFYRYMQTNVAFGPLTFSSFVMSNMCPDASNGLIIEVSEGDSNEDREKFETFLSDPNFEL